VRVLADHEIAEEVQSAARDRFIALPKKPPAANPTSGHVQELRPFRRDDEAAGPPLSVEIPPSEFKDGAIYKLNNCYYDCNGDFLYKTPTTLNT
jgi:hypothetical protein